MMQDLTEEDTFLSSLRQAPADLAVIGLCVVMVLLTTLPVFESTIFPTVIQTLFVGLIPGYTLVAVLFPRMAKIVAHTNRSRIQLWSSEGGLSHLERIALSIAASCGLLALVAGGLFAIPVANRITATVWILAALTIGLIAVAAVCHMKLPPSERTGRPVLVWINTLNPFQSNRLDGDLISTIAFGLVVLFLLSSVAYAMVPAQEDGYTELYLLPGGNDEPVAEDYPDAFTVGEEQQLIVGIGNEEGTPITYSIVVQLQEVEADGSEMNVQSSTELDRFEVNLEDGETIENEHTIAPEQSGENLRLIYLLYVGEPAESPTEENAYRSTHIWIDVEESSG